MGDGESLTESEIAFAQMRGWVIGRLSLAHEEVEKEFWNTAKAMWPSHVNHFKLHIKNGDFELTMDEPPKVGRRDQRSDFNYKASKLISKSGLIGKVKIVWNKDEPPLEHGEPPEREAITDKEMKEILDPEVKT